MPTIQGLPADLIAATLCRLPVKSLLRLRCLSKSWCSEIDNSSFTQIQLRHSKEASSNLSLVLNETYQYFVNLECLNAAVKLEHPLEAQNLDPRLL
ncbi:unnamed protein product [Linum trigynum]|uniref:F-box domain-containing protein n=1 Tax=Linum trigynum TaxID=586398 RepID=A0AAV2CDG1_9ROSI